MDFAFTIPLFPHALTMDKTTITSQRQRRRDDCLWQELNSWPCPHSLPTGVSCILIRQSLWFFYCANCGATHEQQNSISRGSWVWNRSLAHTHFPWCKQKSSLFFVNEDWKLISCNDADTNDSIVEVLTNHDVQTQVSEKKLKNNREAKNGWTDRRTVFHYRRAMTDWEIPLYPFTQIFIFFVPGTPTTTTWRD